MANLSDSITGFVSGDDLEVRRTITDVPATQTLTKAWLTIKAQPSDVDASAVLQKVITPVNVAGTGHIEDTGADGTGVVRFDLTGANTLLLVPNTIYHFDIQVLTSASKLYTPAIGHVLTTQQVTIATS